ncbi:hypothetical protein HY450_03445 [Candidatus Pacearchaeota archaeon]|nr:hypothetical protein [Candidatus Pacearchaeota archaeon]
MMQVEKKISAHMERIKVLRGFEVEMQKPLVIDNLVILRGRQWLDNIEHQIPTITPLGSIYSSFNEYLLNLKEPTEFFVHANPGTPSWRSLRGELGERRMREELSESLKDEAHTTIPARVNAIDIMNPFSSFVFRIGLYCLPEGHYLLEERK